jgi:hypothetical protein
VIRVTKIERAEAGYWQARVTVDGRTIPVDRSCGSWLAPEGKQAADKAARAREVLPAVARELQARVRRLETRERRAIEGGQ